jgi:hypothetical protein
MLAFLSSMLNSLVTEFSRLRNNAAAVRRLIIEQLDPCSKLPMNYKESCAFSLKKTSSNSASRYGDGTACMQPPDGTLDVLNLHRRASKDPKNGKWWHPVD